MATLLLTKDDLIKGVDDKAEFMLLSSFPYRITEAFRWCDVVIYTDPKGNTKELKNRYKIW